MIFLDTLCKSNCISDKTDFKTFLLSTCKTGFSKLRPRRGTSSQKLESQRRNPISPNSHACVMQSKEKEEEKKNGLWMWKRRFLCTGLFISRFKRERAREILPFFQRPKWREKLQVTVQNEEKNMIEKRLIKSKWTWGIFSRADV